MNTIPYLVPVIAENDYPAFRAFLGAQVPAAYGEWVKMITERENESIIRQEGARKIPIKTSNFIAYCETHREQANLASLFRFVQKVAIGEA